MAAIFLRGDCNKNEIMDAGEQIFMLLYDGVQNENLEELRFKMFCAKTSKSASYLTAAAKYHSFRVYLRVQSKLGNQFDPLNWGLKVAENYLVPLGTDLPAAPLHLLSVFRCNCKSHCDTKRCICRNYGFDCSLLCSSCYGIECLNTSVTYLEEV